MSIKAVAYISQVRGGSQARMMLADDGKNYLVKFQGDLQCTRVLLMTTWPAEWHEQLG